MSSFKKIAPDEQSGKKYRDPVKLPPPRGMIEVWKGHFSIKKDVAASNRFGPI